jgi:hypothetical protein
VFTYGYSLMFKRRFRILWILAILAGLSLACESLSAISKDYTQARGTAGAIATQADQIITQAKGIATQIGEGQAIETARALATQQGPQILASGQAFATQAAEGGYLQTVEALITQGSSELIPTFQAVATQYLFPAAPPEDIPIIPIGEVTNLFTNQSTVSYFVRLDLPLVVEFYQNTMPEQGWTDVSDQNEIIESSVLLKFFKPDRVATVSLTANPIDKQTIVLINIRNQ